MKIRTKVLLNVIASGVLIFAISLLAVWIAWQTRVANDHAEDTQDLIIMVFDLNRLLDNYLLTDDEVYAQRWQSLHNDFGVLLEKEAVASPNLATLRQEHQIADNLFERFIQSKDPQERELLEKRLRSTFRSKILAVEEFGDEAEQRLLVSIYSLIGVLLFSLLFLVVSVVGTTWFITRTVTGPLNKITRVTDKVRKGDFDARVEIVREDELGELSAHFNDMLEAVQRAQDEQRQLSQAKSQFLSMTSHELLTPITPIRSQVEMLCDGYFGKLTKEQRESLGMVLRNIKQLDKLSSDLLDVSRLATDHLKFNYEEVNIRQLIDDLLKELEMLLPEKKVRIEVLCRNVSIETDPDRLRQALLNILVNAKKFSPPGGTIRLSVMISDENLQVRIGDEGPGIEKGSEEEIFEPFRQLGKQASGSGLGLAIVKGIIESQGGKVWVESEVGKGSTFIITLPRHPKRKLYEREKEPFGGGMTDA